MERGDGGVDGQRGCGCGEGMGWDGNDDKVELGWDLGIASGAFARLETHGHADLCLATTGPTIDRYSCF